MLTRQKTAPEAFGLSVIKQTERGTIAMVSYSWGLSLIFRKALTVFRLLTAFPWFSYSGRTLMAAADLSFAS